MYRNTIKIFSLLALFFSQVVLASEYVSPMDIVADGNGHLYVADATGNKVLEYDIAANSVSKTIALEKSANAMVIDGGSLYVAAGVEDGCVYKIDIASGAVTETIHAGHSPVAVAVNGTKLYVCNRFSNSIWVIDTTTNAVVDSVAMGREPIDMAISADGAKLFVAHHLPDGPANDNDNAITVAIVDTETLAVNEIKLVNGSSVARGVCISADGAFGYVTHLVGRYQMPTNQLERGWIWTNAFSIVDMANGQYVNTVLVDDIYAGAANPWGIVCSDDGAKLCVTHAGSQEVSVIDRLSLHARLDSVAAGNQVPGGISKKAEDVRHDMSFLSGLRKRVQLKGNGPRSIALVGDKAYVGNYYSESIDSFVMDEKYPAVSGVVIGNGNEQTAARKGEQFFNDASKCYQKWLSCASCHPDGRADGLNWDLGNDGLGSPRNDKSLLMAHFTAPAMITGIRADAETAVNAGFKFIQFMKVKQDTEDVVNAYLSSARAVPSPYMQGGTLSDAAWRGKKLFYQSGCAYCHSGPFYTNRQKYDVGTGRYAGEQLDTPTLIEVWRTGPYLQDGSAATIKDVLTTHNPNNQHGNTSSLSDDEINDLVEYVMSISAISYAGDIDDNGITDLYDLRLFMQQWLAQNCGNCDFADFDNNEKVDMRDFVIIAESWLMEE